jgi:hypothetical protein
MALVHSAGRIQLQHSNFTEYSMTGDRTEQQLRPLITSELVNRKLTF